MSDENRDRADDEQQAWDEEPAFDGSTSPSAWERMRHTADRILRSTAVTAGDLALRSRIEMELASLRIRLRALYSKLGKVVYHLHVAEERDDPLGDEEVQTLFKQIRATLREIAGEEAQRSQLRERARSDEFAGA